MANRKPPRSDTEIADMALRWARVWTPLDGIEPWLRRHLEEMTQLVRVQRWSWSDLARSLNHAGVLYQKGTEWTGRSLTIKAATVRWERRKRERRLISQHSLPVEFLQAALGNLGSVNQLVINVQATASGTITATSGGHTGLLATPPALRLRLPSPPSTIPAAARSAASLEPASSVLAEPLPTETGRRTFGFATLRGLGPATKCAPAPSSEGEMSDLKPETGVDVDDVLARFSGVPRTSRG